MTVKGHSRSSAMSSTDRLCIFITDFKSMLNLLFRQKQLKLS